MKGRAFKSLCSIFRESFFTYFAPITAIWKSSRYRRNLFDALIDEYRRAKSD